MKKLVLFLVVLAMIPAAVAQYTCYTEADLVAKETECRSVGLTHSRYTDERGCAQVRCQEVEHTCLSNEELEKSAQICRDKGIRAAYDIDRYECRFVSCVSARCPSDAEHDSAVLKCKELSRFPEVKTDDEGCRFVNCVDTSCKGPSVEVQQSACARQDMDSIEYQDANGCASVKCAQKQGIACRKVTTGDCSTYTCTDGSSYDTCKGCGGMSSTPTTTKSKGFWSWLFGE